MNFTEVHSLQHQKFINNYVLIHKRSNHESTKYVMLIRHKSHYDCNGCVKNYCISLKTMNENWIICLAKNFTLLIAQARHKLIPAIKRGNVSFRFDQIVVYERWERLLSLMHCMRILPSPWTYFEGTYCVCANNSPFCLWHHAI